MKLVSLRKAAALLGVTRRTLYRYAAGGVFETRIRNQSAFVNAKELGHVMELSIGAAGNRAIMDTMGNMALLERLLRGEERLMKVKDAAALLGVSKSTIHAWVNEGKLNAVKIGPAGQRMTVLVLASSLAAILNDDF